MKDYVEKTVGDLVAGDVAVGILDVMAGRWDAIDASVVLKGGELVWVQPSAELPFRILNAYQKVRVSTTVREKTLDALAVGDHVVGFYHPDCGYKDYVGGCTITLTHDKWAFWQYAGLTYGKHPDMRFRVRVGATVDLSHYPHKCPRCASPAYLGVVPAALDCSKGCRV